MGNGWVGPQETLVNQLSFWGTRWFWPLRLWSWSIEVREANLASGWANLLGKNCRFLIWGPSPEVSVMFPQYWTRSCKKLLNILKLRGSFSACFLFLGLPVPNFLLQKFWQNPRDHKLSSSLGWLVWVTIFCETLTIFWQSPKIKLGASTAVLRMTVVCCCCCCCCCCCGRRRRRCCSCSCRQIPPKSSNQHFLNQKPHNSNIVQGCPRILQSPGKLTIWKTEKTFVTFFQVNVQGENCQKMAL